MTMGDRVAVMKNGRIQQCALPQDDQPATESDLVPVRIAVYHFRTLFGCCHRSTNQTWSLLRHGR
jgi:ABC-type sugar transport system ATPase subunit